MTENVRRSAANEPDSVDGPMFPLIFSRYLSFAPTSPDKKRREIWGTPHCFARKDVGDPTGYLPLLAADYTSGINDANRASRDGGVQYLRGACKGLADPHNLEDHAQHLGIAILAVTPNRNKRRRQLM